MCVCVGIGAHLMCGACAWARGECRRLRDAAYRPTTHTSTYEVLPRQSAKYNQPFCISRMNMLRQWYLWNASDFCRSCHTRVANSIQHSGEYRRAVVTYVPLTIMKAFTATFYTPEHRFTLPSIITVQLEAIKRESRCYSPPASE